MMTNESFLSSLEGLQKRIKNIRHDDGYIIHQVAVIGRSAIDHLNKLETDDPFDMELIKDTIADLSEIDAIEKSYYADDQYLEFVHKRSARGNMTIFMKAINCVEGALDVFFHKLNNKNT